MPPVKLVRQIKGALSSGSNSPVESMASEYAQLCQDANQRLESCAAMIEKGSEYQALQLAETEPVLLDLIATLSFAEAPEWASYCTLNQLPVPPKFDSKAVQVLDGLYAKGISANHPLYKDYRSAVTSRDDGKALHIIRSIVRLNPDDANAKAEHARIENKLFQLQLQELRTVLSQRNEGATIAALSELERLATPARLSELPEFSQAQAVRREVSRREAIAVSERLIESLDEERQANSWRMVGDILARLGALQSEHGFSLRDQAAAKCAEMQQYFATQRAAADEAARFEHAVATLGALAESFDTRLLTRSSLTLPEAQGLYGEFNCRWKEIEKFQRPIPEAFIQRVRASAGALHAELERLQRQRRLKIISVAVVAVVVIAAAAWFTIATVRAQDYATQLAGLRDASQVGAAENMVREVRTEHSSLATQPKLAARLDEVEHWTRDERAKLGTIETGLSELEATAKAGMADTDPMELATKIQSAGQLIDALAGDLRAAPASRLLVMRNQFDAHIAIVREKLIAHADDELTALEKLAGSSLNYDQPKEAVTRALADIDPALKGLEARARPAVTALEFPLAQQARIAALRKRVELFREEVEALAKVSEAVLQATSLETFVQALSGYKASKLSQAQEVNDARKLLAALPKPDDLMAGLLLPGDPVGWAAAKADATRESLAPDTVLPAEISKLVALRDDNYLSDIWEVTFIDYHRKNERKNLYARHDLKKEGPNDIGGIQTTRWVGDIFDPASKAELPVFVPTTFSMQRSAYGAGGDGEVSAKRLCAVSELLNKLELNRMTDSSGSKFERPLLGVFDALVRDTTTSAIFKAYLMQQLGIVLNVRPYAWGMEHCRSLRDDLAELDRLCEGTTLRSQDWLLERKRTQLGGKLDSFFDSLRERRYLAEARLHREIMLRVLKAGLQFGGFIDSAAQLHLLGEARSAKTLWVLTADGQKLCRYLPPGDTGEKAKEEPAGMSPVFFVPLDREALLAELTRKTSAGSQFKLPAMPWLEKP